MTPYFYILEHQPSKRYYVGSRTGKTAHPDELFRTVNGYFTSSKFVKKLIKETGKDSFIIVKTKTFSTPAAAYEYELRFLKKVDAGKNPKFINKSIQKNTVPFGDPRFLDSMMELYGVDNISKHPDTNRKRKQRYLAKAGVDHHMKVPEIVKKIDDTMLTRYGVKRALQHPEFNKKKVETNLTKYGYKNVAQVPEIKQKQQQTNIVKYGHRNAFQNKTVQKKQRETLHQKYNVSNISQIPEVKEKKKDTFLKKYGVSCFINTDESKERRKKNMDGKMKRPEVSIIKQYQKVYKCWVPRAWYWKSTEVLQGYIKEFELQHGPIAADRLKTM